MTSFWYYSIKRASDHVIASAILLVKARATFEVVHLIFNLNLFKQN